METYEYYSIVRPGLVRMRNFVIDASIMIVISGLGCQSCLIELGRKTPAFTPGDISQLAQQGQLQTSVSPKSKLTI